MKYIRTEDGRIIINSFQETKILEDGTFVAFQKMKIKNYKNLRKVPVLVLAQNDILKKADTIEELCDEFVLENIDDIKYAKRIFVYQNKIDEIITELVKEKSINFYGAIWTDKGLIYVAKMNEKGELELL